MPTTLTNPRTMRRHSCDRARRVVPFMQRVRQDDSRGPRRAWRRLRADERGISVESVLIGILLVAALATVAVFAIRWATNLGQTTVARSNLEVAAAAAVTQHGVSLSGEFDHERIENIVPELEFVEADDAIADLVGKAGTPGQLGREGDLAAGQVAYHEGTATEVAIASGSDPYVEHGDVMWLFTRGENGDTYCAVVIAEVRGTDQTAVGTWFDGYPADDAFPAGGSVDICRYQTSAHIAVSTIHTGLSRALPDFS